MLYTNLVRFGVTVSDRVFSTWLTWRAESDGSFILAFAPLEDYDNKERVAEMNAQIARDPPASAAIRATIRGFFKFRPLAPAVCKVTYVAQVRIGGSIPKELLTLRKKSTLGVMQRFQDKYERKGNFVDAEMRAAFPNPPPLVELNDEQRAIVKICREMETAEEAAWEPLTSPSPFVAMWIMHAKPKKGERSIGLAKAAASVECSIREAVAYWSDFVSRKRSRISKEQVSPSHVHTSRQTASRTRD